MDAYKDIEEDYFLDTYDNVVKDFSSEYEMELSDVQELITFEMYVKIVIETNYNTDEIREKSFKLIQIRLFLSDYDVIPTI